MEQCIGIHRTTERYGLKLSVCVTVGIAFLHRVKNMDR